MDDENDHNNEENIDMNPDQGAEPEEDNPVEEAAENMEEEREEEDASGDDSDMSNAEEEDAPVDQRIRYRYLRNGRAVGLELRRQLDSDNEEEEESGNYDINLPPLHLYLGLNPEDVNNGDENSELRPVNSRFIYQNNGIDQSSCPKHEPPLPILTKRVPVLKNTGHYNMPMMPNQDLPLKLFSENDIMAVNAALNSVDKSFICIDLQMKGPLYGTVLEVTRFRTDYSSKIVLAHATSRFRLIDINTEVTGLVVADIEILPDLVIHSPLYSVQLQSLKKHEPPIYGQTNLKKGKIESVNSALTSYPAWVYRQCDMYELAKRLQPHVISPRNDMENPSPPLSPVDLCNTACCELPLLSEQRMELLKMSFIHQRLHYLLNIFEKCQKICCKSCKRLLANRSDMIVISREGPQNAFVNPGGYVHEMITVRSTVDRLRLQGPSSSEHSWFPGYEWIIVNCPGCNQHLGWKFIARTEDLLPKKFYGLSRNGVMLS